ncbi:hypothetical protein BKI52_29725 [marine bacterium AO1-C]|nr:hypothetical protein BKI52_29725 [marine bacterium AO1-C]
MDFSEIFKLKSLIDTYKNVDKRIDEHNKMLKHTQQNIRKVKNETLAWQSEIEKATSAKKLRNANGELAQIEKTLKRLQKVQNFKTGVSGLKNASLEALGAGKDLIPTLTTKGWSLLRQEVSKLHERFQNPPINYVKQLKKIQDLKNKAGKSGDYEKGYERQIAHLKEILKVTQQLEKLKQSKAKTGSNEVAKLKRLERQIGQTEKKLAALTKKNPIEGIGKGVQKAFVPLSQLEKQLASLRKARDSAFSVTQIKHYNAEIANVEKSMAKVQRLQEGRYTKEQKDAAKSQFQSHVSKGLSFIKTSVSDAGKLSDQIADVARYSKLSKKEIKELVSEVQNMRSRTSTGDLLNLAKAGQKFTKTKKEAIDFVKAADMVNVALGDQFVGSAQLVGGNQLQMLGGGGSAVVASIMAIKDAFEQTKNAGYSNVITGVGSAILQLSKNGQSTAPNVLAFAKAMSALGGKDLAGSLALGATFQDANVGAAAAAESIKSIVALSRDAKNADAFTGILGKSMAEIRALDPGVLMVELANKVQGANAPELATKLGFRLPKSKAALDSVNVLLQLSKSTAKYDQHLKTVGAELGKVNALTQDYSLKNSTLQANLDIANNSFTRLKAVIGGALAPAIDWLSSRFTQLTAFIQTHWNIIGPLLLGFAVAIGILSLSFIQLQIAALPISIPILTLAVGIGLLVAAFSSANPLLYGAAIIFLILTRRTWATMFANAALRASMLATAVAQRAAAISTFLMAGAMRVLNFVMKMNPILGIVSLILLLIGVFSGLFHKITFIRTVFEAFFGLIRRGISWISGIFSKFFSFMGDGLDKTGKKMDGLSSKAKGLTETMNMPAQAAPSFVNGVTAQVKSAEQMMKMFKEYKEGKEFKFVGLDDNYVTTKSAFLNKYLLKREHLFDEVLKAGILPDVDKAHLEVKNIKLPGGTPVAKGFKRLVRNDGTTIDYKVPTGKHKDVSYYFSAYWPVVEKLQAYNKQIRKEDTRRKQLGITSLTNAKSTVSPATSINKNGHFNKDSKENKNLQGGLQQVSASGVKEKNYNIQIGSFVDGDFVVKTENVETGTQQTYDKFLEMFMRVINNAQQS